ncbi:MAG: hypothetical protein ACI3YP_02395 [Prevotella sp.]|nr:hypothetical protein [Prevotella sp.]MDD6819608.1 hypothetical protein [Prevotella sp.]MDY4653664.1 hypothetical protein [Prevotella sp.]
MKRLFLTVVAVLTMTATFAENEKANSVNNANAYDMKVNMSKLGEALNLTQDQMESVADVHRTFCGEMLVASQANEEDRKALVEKAVLKELRYMNYLLNDKQYRTYVMLLNTTLNNRGLNK